MVGFDCFNEKECLEAVKQDGLALEYVKEQTPEICLESVKQNGLALEYVDEPFSYSFYGIYENRSMCTCS